MRELEKIAAAQGLATPPHVLTELDDLRKKYPRRRTSPSRHAALDYEFLMGQIERVLIRFNQIEAQWQTDQKARRRRQRIMDIWLTVICVGLVIIGALVWFKL